MLNKRSKALEAGSVRYFTGKACTRGHISERLASNGKCVKCNRENIKIWNAKNPEIVKLNGRRYQFKFKKKIKLEVITALGGKCACCGVKAIVFLCADHINGKGRQHRIFIKRNGGAIYNWLRQQIRDTGIKEVLKQFRVLCWNCNSARHILGYCPHRGPKGTL